MPASQLRGFATGSWQVYRLWELRDQVPDFRNQSPPKSGCQGPVQQLLHQRDVRLILQGRQDLDQRKKSGVCRQVAFYFHKGDSSNIDPSKAHLKHSMAAHLPLDVIGHRLSIAPVQLLRPARLVTRNDTEYLLQRLHCLPSSNPSYGIGNIIILESCA